ncbi:response regulator [Telmatospirillum siberiense]|nr:response regulator [Telmatospirillum siberiense]
MSASKTMLSGRRIMIADDESFSRFFVVRMIKELGCDDIVEAVDGADTLAQLKRCGEDLSVLILDFNMPHQNGLTVLKMIRTGAAEVPRDTNVLMLTGSSDFVLVGAAMALDVDAFLIKPVSEAALVDRLTKIFAESRELKTTDVYESVDIELVSQRVLGAKPPSQTPRVPLGSTIRASEAPPREIPGTARVAFDEVAVGAILAENVRAPTGELLLGAATVLSERLLNRLRELQPAIKLDYVRIYVKDEGRDRGS